MLGPRNDDGTRDPVDEAQWILGGPSESVEHGERITNEGATVRTTASCHEIVATRALCTERGSPVLTVLDPKRLDETQARRRDAVRETTIIEIEATFPRETEASNEAISRLLKACIDGEARVVAGEIRQDTGTGEVHAAEGTTIRHPRLPEKELSALDPDQVHVQYIGARTDEEARARACRNEHRPRGRTEHR